jgi:hypothetical protein
MKNGLRKAIAGVTALAIAMGFAPPTFAFGSEGGFSHSRGWHRARIHAYGRDRNELGWGCGPFGHNEDGWDIGWAGACYYPYYGDRGLFDYW